MVAAKMANIQCGANQHTEGRSIDPPSISNAKAAKLLNISEPTVKRAKRVLRDGSRIAGTEWPRA
jgi:hypothetical protein